MSLDISNISARFGWADYTVFGLMLSISAGIGVYFGFCGKKQDSDDFLRAGKSASTFPVAMSLIASFMSAITLLGSPSEVYQYGTIYYLIGFSYIIVTPAAIYLYLPVFQKLDVTSAYEYLEVRFHRSVRLLCSGIFMVQMSMYMAIVVYAPALALSQVTGMNLYLIECLICIVCIFYTTIGGMKAVLWTDALQVVVMYGAISFVVVKGAIDVGGWSYVWEKNLESGRVQYMDWDPNPTTRHTFWTLVIGGYFTWVTTYAVNQASVQRFMSVREPYMARRALWLNLAGLIILMLICSYAGMVIYAKYWDCDPIRSGTISKGDQLFPLFVMDILGDFPGLPGLFVAGICSGSLSTVSSGINSLAAITLEDFIKGVFLPDISDKDATRLSKILSLLYGVLTFALVFVAEQLGNILSAALSIRGMLGGPLLGVFSLGMFFPWANTKGALIGTLAGVINTLWIGFGYQIVKAYGQISYPEMPTSIAGCTSNSSLMAGLNTSYLTDNPITDSEQISEASAIFRLSYLWYSAVGCFTVIIVGVIVSLATGKQDVRKVNPDCITPILLMMKDRIPGLRDLGCDYVDLHSKKGSHYADEEENVEASLIDLQTQARVQKSKDNFPMVALENGKGK